MSTRNNQFTNRAQKATLHVAHNLLHWLAYVLWIAPALVALCCLAPWCRQRNRTRAGVRPESSKIHAVFSKETIPVK